MSKPIVNIDELEFMDWGHGERFEAKLGQIGARIGARDLGYNLTILPPGKAAFPIHSHRVNEEMFFIVEGEGEMRYGSDRHPVRQGDVIACPTGGAETAHQIINTMKEGEFLAVSTTKEPEICEYPDSGKYGIYAAVKNEQGEEERLRFITRECSGPDEYWEGED